MLDHLPPPATNGHPRPALPAPTRERWQPLRGGLLNLYRYDYEEFRFEKGHLLLRGNNGTGKSRVLALQLPFLFDGETAPHRIEPDRDPAKKIEWNLLLGKHADRLGYTFIEFGRRDHDGVEHYLTLGCGLRAVEGRGMVGKWFFITSQRVGRELFLQSPSGQALSRDKLAEAIGAQGRVYEAAKDYRVAVDQQLFQLGAQRYEALVSLLIQLRQPQLSRKLDEEALSGALSEALPPVSTAILGDVAESFRSLESDRETLEAFVAARRGTEAFLVEYGGYARIAARRRAASVRAAQSDYENAMRRLRAAETELADSQGLVAELAQLAERLAIEEKAAAAVVHTLADSPQMRDARALDAARQAAEERLGEARRAADDLASAARLRAEREHQRDLELAAAAEALDRAKSASKRAQLSALDAGLERDHRLAVEPLAQSELGEPSAVAPAKSALADAADRQLRACRHVQQLNQDVERAAAALARVQEAQAALASQLDEALEAERAARDRLDLAAAEMIEAFRLWLASLEELPPPDLDELAENFAAWCESAEGKSPFTAAAEQAAISTANRLAALRADRAARVEQAERELADLRKEHRRLGAGHHQPPQPPYTRDVAARSARAGAPLWKLIDFAPDVAESRRAGLEAALEAAGLLDAWLMPDGRLLDVGDHDTVLAAGGSPLAPEGRELTRVLVPAVDRTDPRAAEIAEETIRSVLRHIGFGRGSGNVWVSDDGTWQVGPLHGAWAKPAAEHIGHAAREAARRRRMEELEQFIASMEEELIELRAAIDDVDRREAIARREADAAPDDGAVRTAVARIAAAAGQTAGLRQRLDEAERRVVERGRELASIAQRRDRDALDLGIAAWVDRPRDLEDAVHAYRQQLAELWPAIEGRIASARQATASAERANEARNDEQRRAERHLDAQKKAQAAVAERDTLDKTVGAAVEEVLRLLAEAREQAERLRRENTATSKRQTESEVRRAVAQSNIESASELLRRDTEARDAAVVALRRFAATRMLELVAPALADAEPASWSITKSVEVARSLETILSESDSGDEAWTRAESGIHRYIQELGDALLEHGYEPTTASEDGLLVVTVPFQGRGRTVAELRDALIEEVTTRQNLLDAREREVLENHLIGEVATHLHERLHAAEQWVREMNAELHDRPTSTGMVLRFTWQPREHGPPGLLEARRRLLSSGGMWSPDEREALGRFLQDQIQDVRRANESGAWQDHLVQAFDYRRWHQFGVERKQDGQWKRLTRRTHGTGSGGEKAIALTLPQFAAAAAHYRSAHPHAPRLILLDEAFVGIDSDMRAKCMGLLGAFDLDFVMTSEREWACYATLPGVAIYQLATRPEIDAVGVTRWVWNGRERRRDDRPLPAAAPPVAGDL